MPLDLTGQPLIDRPDFAELLAAGRFGPWAAEAEAMHRQGFCVVDGAAGVVQRHGAALIAELGGRLGEELAAWGLGEAPPPRLQDGWRQIAAIRELALCEAILDLLRHLYGREPFAFQTLNFAVGSEQPYHSDAVHFHSYPQGFMCGVWLALQDIEADSGPLDYFPGSHRLPYLSAASLGLDPAVVAEEPHPQRFFEPFWQEAVAAAGLERQCFLPRCGQALIWHANLLHGGSPVSSRTSRRWSQVTHCFFADCLYTTPLRSFRHDQGGTDLRNPYDIATGRRRYNSQQWESLGLTRSPAVQHAQFSNEA
jgi:hypothetical protein